jgi:hypothetical protein
MYINVAWFHLIIISLAVQVKVKVAESGLSIKEKVKLITELTEDISAAVISYHRYRVEGLVGAMYLENEINLCF